MCPGDTGVYEEVYRKVKERNLIYAEEIAQYCEKVSHQLKAGLVILHGSTAKGLHGKWSDIDLVVIADFDTPFLDRIGKLLELNERRAPIEPLGYTPKEFNAMLLKLNPLALEAVKNGIPLIGENLFAQLKGTLNRIERNGLRRTKVTWSFLGF